MELKLVAVYTGVLSRYQAASVKVERTSIFKLNLVLMLAASIVVLAYIFMSNFLVSQKYALGTRKSELNQLNAKLMAEKQYEADYDLKGLLFFAQKSGLVEAKDIDSILENDSFAVIP